MSCPTCLLIGLLRGFASALFGFLVVPAGLLGVQSFEPKRFGFFDGGQVFGVIIKLGEQQVDRWLSDERAACGKQQRAIGGDLEQPTTEVRAFDQ